jgi:SAM-dependent methyltransferase
MSVLNTNNPYTTMQRNQYEREADLMNEENHMFHNANQDYWDILVADTEIGFRDKLGLDFGCGCGRNIQNLWYRFKSMDGVDISEGNLIHARENIDKAGCPSNRSKLYICNGIDLSNIQSDQYDFVMSTIVLQHIAVHDIRYNYLKEFYRIMREGGLLSFQMGFGEGHGKAAYHENHYHATATNSLHDAVVTDSSQITDELFEIGFKNITYAIRPPFSDGHPNWIFVKAYKIEKKSNIAVFSNPVDIRSLEKEKVSYQAAQFYHLQNFSNTILTTDLTKAKDSEAFVVFDESTLLMDEQLQKLDLKDNQLLVYVSHDYWCHPLKVAETLKKYKNVLMILRHFSAKTVFDYLLPDIPKIIQRPGVETTIFHPHDGIKKYDILIGGSETPDYPIRQRINRIVREYKAKYQWNVLDLTGIGLLSNPQGAQFEYAPLLAASKISPTATNRGGAAGAKLLMQYFDHPFYGLKNPEISFLEFNTAGITPRYLESLASKCLLIGDLPDSDFQEWYADKMVIINEQMSDDSIAETFDYWIKNDAKRERLVNYAYEELLKTDTSLQKARELSEIIDFFLSKINE